MTAAPALTIEAAKGRFYICAGRARLASYKTQAAAEASLQEKASFWAFWAGSAGVFAVNDTREPRVINA